MRLGIGESSPRAFEEYYKIEGDTSFGGEAGYRHAWNTAGRLRLQVSLRERPTLVVSPPPAEAAGLLQLPRIQAV